MDYNWVLHYYLRARTNWRRPTEVKPEALSEALTLLMLPTRFIHDRPNFRPDCTSFHGSRYFIHFFFL